MEKMMPPIESATENIEKKKEMLLPIFKESEDSFYASVENPEKLARLTVSRKKPNGLEEVLDGLVVIEIHGEGPEFCLVDENNNPGASATMLWKEIIDAKKE